MPEQRAELEQNRLVLQELVRRSNNDSRRLKELEQRIDAVENKIKTVETSVLRRAKDNDAKTTELESMMQEMQERIVMFQNMFDKFNKQVSKFAMRRELKELEHMLELLNPITGHFVTDEKLDEKIRELREHLLIKENKD